MNHYLNGWSLLPWKPTTMVHGRDIATLDNRTIVPIGADPYADRGCAPPPDAVFVRPVDGREWPDTASLAGD